MSNAGRANTPRQYETTCDSRVSNCRSVHTSLLPEVTAESGMPLVKSESVSQGD